MSRKRIAGIVFALLMISAIGFFALSVSKKHNRREEIKSTMTLSNLGESLDFSLSQYLDPTLVLIVNSECEHCQWQVEALHQQNLALDMTNLIFISIESRDTLINYLTEVGFSERKIVAFEKEPKLIKAAIGSVSTPQLLIYNQNQLVKHYKGETRVDLILKSLSDED